MRLRPTYPVMLAADTAPANAAANVGRVALVVADDFVVPVYRALAAATAAQERSWAAFVADRGTGDFESLQRSYNAACDAWARAQIVRTGPITLFLRYERFAYWPEARNVTQRALGALLGSENPDDLLPERLATNSVAGQGLTALERLLYDGEGSRAALSADDAQSAWRAQVGWGLARNLNGIANEVLTDWTAPGGVRDSIAAGQGWNDLFADDAEAARLLLTDLVGAFRLMHDLKLLPVLGDELDNANPRLAEAWRSGRPVANLRENLSAAEDLTRVFARPLRAARRAEIEQSFGAAFGALDALPADLGDAAADPMRRHLVEAARDAIKATQLVLAEILPGDLGITLGFNALDGD